MKFEIAKYTSKSILSSTRKVLLAGYMLLATSSFAQTVTVTEVEIDRDAGELADLLVGASDTRPDVASLLNTAMVLTNISDAGSIARCHANNRNGLTVGRIRLHVPAGGVRFFLLSDLVKDRGFVGSVICNVPGHAIGTEIMLGLITTDIEVQQDYREGITSMLFPVTAMR